MFGFAAQALAKYAFGLGLLQMVFSTAAFTIFSLPVGAGIGTVILEKVIITRCRLPITTYKHQLAPNVHVRVLLRKPAPRLSSICSRHSTCVADWQTTKGRRAFPMCLAHRQLRGWVLHEQVFQVPHYLAAIRSVDEAVVIGVALSLSSSAFVLQLLTERGELTTKFGSATLGILLAQVSATCHVTRTLEGSPSLAGPHSSMSRSTCLDASSQSRAVS